ncbi:DNA/RNA non-specific endonuclease [Furfurilactobacillus milii]|uniref:DNA/RNA non-specific endonuclease n=1 Tax=Furfurilactobacillus milii TaxID=2888272 RepID=A0A6N9I5B7_9LACO|nr:DNA/RNA non-specific endonuclease [Furfurilactobacillus milii]MYV18165.1 DNA/RNA non-specific endonuclease [Furfurilactobacillus milii]
MRNRQNVIYTVVAAVVVAIVFGAFTLSRQASGPVNQSQQQTTQSSHEQTSGQGSTQATDAAALAKLTYASGKPAVVAVNHNRSTLNKNDWQRNHVIYSSLDNENRTSTANTAYLESHNVANDSLRVRQYVQPTGWHQKMVNGQAIINRGHLIAYSLSGGIDQDGEYSPNNESGDQNNPKNLFTQTAFSNQTLQTIYESKVRNALRDNKKVIYQAQAIFQGDNEMANGVHLQAISTDGSLNFNVYIFNVQPDFQFDYATGRSKVDRGMDVPTPDESPEY